MMGAFLLRIYAEQIGPSWVLRTNLTATKRIGGSSIQKETARREIAIVNVKKNRQSLPSPKKVMMAHPEVRLGEDSF